MTNYQEQIVKLTSSGYWYAVPTVSWIELPVASGNGCTAKELVVRIEDNPNAVARTGYVNFTGGSKTCILTINQGAGTGSTGGIILCNTDLSKNDGIYTSNLATFPTGYYEVPISETGLTEYEFEVSGTTTCGSDGEENYNLVFAFPTKASIKEVDIFSVLEQKYVSYSYTLTDGYLYNGEDYTMVNLKDTYQTCDGVTNKFKLIFNNELTI